MDKKRQIEEILHKLKHEEFCKVDCYGCCGDGALDITCPIVIDNFIKALYNAGYRKVDSDTQDEIERLKDENAKLKCDVNDWKQRFESRK